MSEVEWSKKRKGNAIIYTHPGAFEQRAVVSSPYGISFNGVIYSSVEEAKKAALRCMK
jgi:hypothetical protein